MLLPSAAPLFVFDPTRFQFVAIPPIAPSGRVASDERPTALPNPPFQRIPDQRRACEHPDTGIAVLHQAMRADRALDFTDDALKRLQPQIDATFGANTPVCVVARSRPAPSGPAPVRSRVLFVLFVIPCFQLTLMLLLLSLQIICTQPRSTITSSTSTANPSRRFNVR